MDLTQFKQELEKLREYCGKDGKLRKLNIVDDHYTGDARYHHLKDIIATHLVKEKLISERGVNSVSSRSVDTAK